MPQVPGDFSSDIILNAGRSTVKGGEVELNWTSGKGLSVYSAIGIADTTFKEFSFLQFGELRDLTGDPFPQAPGVTANFGAQYQHRSGIFGGADITHTGSSLSRSLLEAGLRDELPSYTLVNLRGGWTRGPWRLSVWADNLFDELYFRYRYDRADAPSSRRWAAAASSARISASRSSGAWRRVASRVGCIVLVTTMTFATFSDRRDWVRVDLRGDAQSHGLRVRTRAGIRRLLVAGAAILVLSAVLGAIAFGPVTGPTVALAAALTAGSVLVLVGPFLARERAHEARVVRR